ncbi:MAG: ATP12 family chaperone protein [Geminicoccaceae bacterium]
MKRFYQAVGVAPSGPGRGVLLDQHPVRTPAKRLLILPTVPLAEAIAGEWRDQGDTIRPEAMPLTRLASTAIDRMPELRQAAIDEVVAYVDTDLLCYRAAEPFDLVQRQHHVWQPVLDWLSAAHGIRLCVTTSILPLAQPEVARGRLRTAIEDLPDWPLVGVHAATTALGSLALGLAVLHGRIDAEAAVAASLLDELFEIERWGTDPEAERRHAVLRRDITGAARFIQALHQPSEGGSNPAPTR